MAIMDFSLIIPIYCNENEIDNLFIAIEKINHSIQNNLEVVFVIDGSPDNSFININKKINLLKFPAQVLVHSRNFGSFSAIRTGLQNANGNYFGVMSADLQEPPELICSFYEKLKKDECDVIIGIRDERKDPILTKFFSMLFWTLYRKFIFKDMPRGGVDIFGCNKLFRDNLLKLNESRSSLIVQIFWLGFRKSFLGYSRKERLIGKSTWTFRKKIQYMLDSIFSFTDLPITFLIFVGLLGVSLSFALAILIILLRLMQLIVIPGYAPIMLSILFLSSINLIGLGVVGIYSWRAYENTKNRPLGVISSIVKNKNYTIE